MALSNTFDYTVTGSDVITGALEDIQVVKNGETVDNADLTTALRELNLLVKQWMGKPGSAPGLKRWSRKYAYQFLRLNKNVYNLQAIAGGGDYCARDTYNQCTLTAAAAQGASSITVGAVTSAPTNTLTGTLANGDYIGIKLDGGDFQWTTINGSPSLPTVNLTATLTGAASSTAQVYSFPVASQIDVPLDILTLKRRDVAGIDYEVEKLEDIQQYEAIPNKNITTTPIQYFYEKKLTNGLLYINGFPATVTDVLRMVCLYPLDDETTTANTVAFPQQWYGALTRQLGKILAPKFGKSWTDTMEQNRLQALLDASAVDPEVVTTYFEPGRE